MNERSLTPVVVSATPVHHEENQQKKKLDPADIFAQIDRIRQSFDPEPSLLAQVISPGARQHAEALAEAKVSAIRARRAMIDGLADCISTYISAHRADLVVRGDAFVMTTFAMQCRTLNIIVEETYTSFIESYSFVVDRISAIPNLTEAMRQDQLGLAWDRALNGQSNARVRFERLLDEMTTQVERAMREIGK